MSKPDDIPQSVWDAACVKALEYVEWLVPQPSDIEGSEYVLAGVIARAIMAETARCAAIARKTHVEPPGMGWMSRGDAYRYAVNHGVAIAQQIDAAP